MVQAHGILAAALHRAVSAVGCVLRVVGRAAVGERWSLLSPRRLDRLLALLYQNSVSGRPESPAESRRRPHRDSKLTTRGLYLSFRISAPVHGLWLGDGAPHIHQRDSWREGRREGRREESQRAVAKSTHIPGA